MNKLGVRLNQLTGKVLGMVGRSTSSKFANTDYIEAYSEESKKHIEDLGKDFENLKKEHAALLAIITRYGKEYGASEDSKKKDVVTRYDKFLNAKALQLIEIRNELVKKLSDL